MDSRECADSYGQRRRLRFRTERDEPGRIVQVPVHKGREIQLHLQLPSRDEGHGHRDGHPGASTIRYAVEGLLVHCKTHRYRHEKASEVSVKANSATFLAVIASLLLCLGLAVVACGGDDKK